MIYGKLLDNADELRLCVRICDGSVMLVGRVTQFTETAVSLRPTTGFSPEFVVLQPDI